MKTPFNILWNTLRFCAYFVAFFLLPYAAVVAFINWKAIPYNKGNFYTAISHKLNMIDTVPSPRLVCIGGSATAFSVNSHQLRDSLGIPVVNAGMSAGMGYKSILTLGTEKLRKGDIALFILEHGFYYNRQNQGNGDKTLYEFLATNPAYLKKINLDQWINMPTFANEVTLANIRRWQKHQADADKVYSSKGINEYGDMISHKGKKPTKKTPSAKQMKYKINVSPVFLDYANKVFDDLTARGVTVLVSYPAVSQSYSWKPTLDETMRADLHAIKIGTPQEVVFHDSLFYDTDYHLRYECRQEYNAWLGKHIRKALHR